jgi:putative oxidoreductase
MRQTLVAAHVPFPDFSAIFVSMVEFVFGSFLVRGFATPLVCVMLGGVMIVAIATTAIKILARHLRSAGSRNFYIFPKCSVS